MRPRRLFLAVVCAVLACLGSLPVRSGTSPVVNACRTLGAPARLCTGTGLLLNTVGVVCRDATAMNLCNGIDATTISPGQVTAHEHSWLARALALQRGLDDSRPLQDELWVHTHNSFNADVYPPTFYGIDRNQIYSITDQLRMGVRAVELDVHWAHSAKGDPAHGFKALLVCHGNTELGAGVVHVGCGVNDRVLGDYLTEIRTWMNANPSEVLLLYLENQLDADPYAHELAASEIERVFGPLVYRTPSDCAALPMDTSRRQIRDSGKRILITGNCDVHGGAWGGVVHERGPRWIEGGLGAGTDFPAFPCVAERARDNYANNLIRHYADETGLSNGTGGGGDVTVDDARNEVRCGVNLIGFDNLVPFDPRVQQLVWSWAPNEPVTSTDGSCASHGPDGRFRAEGCGGAKRFACYDGAAWGVTTAGGSFDAGAAACTSEGLGEFAVPWTGYENELLKLAKGAAGAVWVDYLAAGGAWVS